ncbi:hypothetical protein COW99_04105 [Candidatus Roizmanbacteria bacterium CG22_combo_CG10-13_8_21_14_all_38_20]|uniref:Uncharacterized protein n=1 Tax=Candidatus Roizmanbacteria bacterium CG22_combo_CG10-13_8_21_14_all_38_20 TaxID=1974862 RepID=A0A2H0BUV1_9BACT|nr:MAG: hypothetical protein COW99_04105 [Candidatus Roizmanbacteria bacterium CG22_combo_CG10-13_8_21_14_all_38_20]PJC30684.1 MAG: hypothetical protein CO050_05275 [Candidatus Roizmanbacteria bacterium CG_4_9_14_0_2_um_filter_38_17]
MNSEQLIQQEFSPANEEIKIYQITVSCSTCGWSRTYPIQDSNLGDAQSNGLQMGYFQHSEHSSSLSAS